MTDTLPMTDFVVAPEVEPKIPVGYLALDDEVGTTYIFMKFSDHGGEITLPIVLLDDNERDAFTSTAVEHLNMQDMEMDEEVIEEINDYKDKSGLPFMLAAHLCLNKPEDKPKYEKPVGDSYSELCAIQGLGSAGKSTLSLYFWLREGIPVADFDIYASGDINIKTYQDKAKDYGLGENSTINDVVATVPQIRQSEVTPRERFNGSEVEAVGNLLDTVLEENFSEGKRPRFVLMDTPGLSRLTEDGQAFEKGKGRPFHPVLDLVSFFGADRRILRGKDINKMSDEERETLVTNMKNELFKE